MLKITVPESEFYDDSKQEFVSTRETTLTLEHSLLSVSKWESKWKVPFLNNKKITGEQFLDYIRCMTIAPNVDPMVYASMDTDLLQKIKDYIDDPMTATWFSEDKGPKKPPPRKAITSEIIYFWMFNQGIPLEWEKRHLNKLLTLIRVCSIENAPPDKMSKKDIYARQKAINAYNKARFKSKG